MVGVHKLAFALLKLTTATLWNEHCVVCLLNLENSYHVYKLKVENTILPKAEVSDATAGMVLIVILTVSLKCNC